jgi:predicted porin
MKKTLVALAALAATSAFAQSSVTMYGVIDQGVFNKSSTQAGSSTAADNVTYKVRSIGDDQASSHGEGSLWGSRIGFKGEEGLGGGNTAYFQIEMGLFPSEKTNAATGPVAGTSLRNRNSFVGVKGNFGDVKLGRVYTLVWATQNGAYDPGQNNGMYGWLGGQNGSGNRQANAIMYSTPTINGLTASAMIGYGGSYVNSGADATTTIASNKAGEKMDEVKSVGLAYANGPVTANYAWEKTTNHSLHDLTWRDTGGNLLGSALQLVGTDGAGVTTAGKAPDATVNALGVSYNLGMAKVGYVNNSMKLDTATSFTATKVSASGLTVGVPVGQWNFFGSVSKANNDASTQLTAKGKQLGAYYDFSKRTSVYVLWGETELTSGTQNVKFDSNAVGIRHQF